MENLKISNDVLKFFLSCDDLSLKKISFRLFLEGILFLQKILNLGWSWGWG